MPDPFEGTWSINLSDERSKAWDKASKAYVKDEIGSEVITLKTHDNVQHYEVVYGTSPKVRMGYASRYDDTQWVPYLVYSIDDGSTSTSAYGPTYTVGEPQSYVRTIKVDERTHYRIARSPQGRASGAMLRRLAEDGQSYKSIVLDVNGIVRVVRIFVRVAA